MTSGPITSWQIDGETMETVTDFISWAPKSLQMVTAAMKLKDACSLEAMTNLDNILKSRDITLMTKIYLVKAIYCHPAYLTYIESTTCEMSGWMKHKLKSSLPGEISITSDMQMTPPLWQKTMNERAS